jgi:shikimate dehydrogenase
LRLFGLTGYPLGYSFSQTYFRNKFEKEAITGCDYLNFPIASISELPGILQSHPQLEGLNVTIPYKQQVLQYVHEQTAVVRAIGAANCLHILNGHITAHNTDAAGFEQSLLPLLQPHHTQALVLGSGGAAQAVMYVLGHLGIAYRVVTRNAAAHRQALAYEALDEAVLSQYTLIINTTPVGTSPNVQDCPNIPYQHLTPRHLLYDLIYKPATTLFLQKGAAQGATIKNGYEMLLLQADASWAIWQSPV